MRRLLLLAACLGLGATAAAAQGDAGCQTAIDTLSADPTLTIPAVRPNSPCGFLADQLMVVLRQRAAVERAQALDDLTLRDIQPAQGSTGGLVGTAAQSEAVAGTQPVALAGGTVAAAGTSEGSGSITAISLNPALFFGSENPAEAARLSRLADVTVLVPIDDLQGPAGEGPDYLGVRARYSLSAADQAADFFKELTAEYDAFLGEVGAVTVSATEALASAPDATACARALLGSADVEAACGQAVRTFNPDREAAFADAAARARRKADASYFGLDGLLDIGDPSLGSTPGADGVAAGVGVAYGKRFGDAVDAPQVRLRLALSYADREAEGDGRFGGALGVGVEFSRPHGVQKLAFGGGLELRVASGAPVGVSDEVAALDESFIRFRGAVNVPLGSAYSASLVFGTGTDGPVFTVGGNWQLLLPGGPGL